MPPAPRACPACSGKMQSFFAEGVNLDRCVRCLGSWLDDGELASLTEGRIKVEPFEGSTDRRCHRCKKTLTTALLSIGTPVEQCPSCHGLFLDAGELEEVNYNEAADTQRQDEKLGQFYFFFCVRCGERHDTRKARDTDEGVVCAGCFKEDVQTSLGKPPVESGLRRLLSRFRS